MKITYKILGLLKILAIKNSGVSYVTLQGRSHAFKTGGAQAAKIILGPFYLKKWGAQPYFYCSLSQKVGGPGPPGP